MTHYNIFMESRPALLYIYYKYIHSYVHGINYDATIDCIINYQITRFRFTFPGYKNTTTAT